MAALCVALMAFVMIERSSTSDPCHTASFLTQVDQLMAASASFEDDRSDQDGSAKLPIHQHHCCSAHSIGLPDQGGVAVADFQGGSASIVFQNEHVIASATDGPERPPRRTIIA